MDNLFETKKRLLATHFQLHFNLPLAEVRGGSPEDAVIDGEIDR